MTKFTPNRSLLDPRFEGYKLSFTPSPALQYVLLPKHASQSRVGVSSLGFQQVASRVRHNHLAVGDGNAMYVADDGSVVLVTIDGEPSLRIVFGLPEFVSDLNDTHAEYPAAAYITQNKWVISDGHGGLSLISIPNNGSAHLLASFEFIIGTRTLPTPFQLHSVSMITPVQAVAVISSSVSHDELPLSSSKDRHHLFDVWAVRIPIPTNDVVAAASTITATPLETIWRRRGMHIPLYTTYIPNYQSFLIISGSSYQDVSLPITQPYDPDPDEIVPVPRLDENFDLASTITSLPPPYSWTQTNDSVTIAYAIPGGTPKESIHATLHRTSLSLHAGNPPLPRPMYNLAPLWDTIDPSSSLWTWERGSETKAGLLTLHLEKGHPGTRWSSVFSQGFEPVDVPETLDPSELANIRDMLDKYTASLQDGSGLGHGVPSLSEGERDNEVDSSVGYAFKLTWVGENAPVDDALSILLSLPLPGIQQPLSLVVKNDIDGPIFALDEAGMTWTHTATYPALGFVLASKRDTRFTFHVGSQAVLAFESGARNGGGGNVYIYRGISIPNAISAKQGVFQQSPGAGTLIGVGAITSKTGEQILLCLSELELTVCRNVF
ncbi:hypothetical protein BU17DRAFT_49856 [Hysterangium stoloniferum]|nr:hypothetical protein BU17DRAFT_49856 [Hysterangium stoloniferum]